MDFYWSLCGISDRQLDNIVPIQEDLTLFVTAAGTIAGGNNCRWIAKTLETHLQVVTFFQVEENTQLSQSLQVVQEDIYEGIREKKS